MKLLLDQHFSRKLAKQLQDAFPGSTHAAPAGLTNSSDDGLWQFAKAEGFIIVTRDEDFQVLSFTRGHPPKVIWVRSGTQSTSQVEELLRRARPIIEEFCRDTNRSMLTLA